MNKPCIAILIDTLNGGGAEKVCLTLAKALQNENATVHIIVLKNKRDYELPDNLNIHFLSEQAHLRLHNKQAQYALAKTLQEYVTKLGPFDLHLSNLDDCHQIVSLANLPRTYYVIHNSVEESLKRLIKLGPFKYFRKKHALQCLNNRNLVTVSKGVEKELLTAGRIHAKSLRTIYNPIDLDEIQTLSLLNDADVPSVPYIVHIGRFAKQKRHDVLFKALQHWPDPPKVLLLTKPSKKLERALKRYNLTHCVEVLGFKQNPYAIIRRAKALVLCSDFEGFGVVIAEALACGTPVVSTDCPHGPNELLTGELAKYLVPCNNPLKLQKALLDAVKTPQAFADAQIIKQLDMQNIAKQYLALIKS